MLPKRLFSIKTAILFILFTFFMVKWTCMNIAPAKNLTKPKNRNAIFVPMKTRPFIFTFDTLPEIENCEELRVLGIVQSAPANFQIRSAIRETWGSSNNVSALKEDARFVFLLGQSDNQTVNEDVEIEAREYNDIIRYDMLDSYRKLVFKSLIMTEFFRSECPAEMLIKIDEDVIFHIDRFLSLLDEKISLTNSTSFIGGVMVVRSTAMRNPEHKWYVPYDAYPGRYFPMYAKGHAYAISRNAVAEIMQNLPKQNYFAVEDAYLTGMLSLGTNVTLVQLFSRDRVGSDFGLIPVNTRCLNGLPTVFQAHGFKTETWIKNGWKTFLAQNKQCKSQNVTEETPKR